MAAPETVELRAMDDAALSEELQDAHQALFNLRFQGATRQLADVSTVGKARKRVARIATLLREREILAEVDAEEPPQAAADEAADDGPVADVAEAGEAEADDDEADDDEAADDESGDDKSGDDKDEE